MENDSLFYSEKRMKENVIVILIQKYNEWIIFRLKQTQKKL